ncbi:hypothetical protein C1646_676877 [Rhizophagus diaphanus]|nr:hypothetical protein C1646_676877 [Rhizophagus diaphanus] [Rhizophagus sp. MUCL 43196]
MHVLWDKLELFICEQVGLIYKNEYTLAYKSYSESGAGTLLSNEEVFDEFLKDYQKVSKKQLRQGEISEQESDNGSDDDAQNTTISPNHNHQKNMQRSANKNADLDTPPNYAMFSMMHSVKVIKRNSSNNVADTDQSLSISSQTSLDHNLTKKTIPSMKDFLKNLDQEYGDRKFTCYLSVFEEQEILVNQLTRLSESEYISIGVTIIGRRQILHNEAKKYE